MILTASSLNGLWDAVILAEQKEFGFHLSLQKKPGKQHPCIILT